MPARRKVRRIPGREVGGGAGRAVEKRRARVARRRRADESISLANVGGV